ncbi:MAG: hypothetical protein WAO98_03305 [Alphaproteobacteria bacterium]
MSEWLRLKTLGGSGKGMTIYDERDQGFVLKCDEVMPSFGTKNITYIEMSTEGPLAVFRLAKQEVTLVRGARFLKDKSHVPAQYILGAVEYGEPVISQLTPAEAIFLLSTSDANHFANAEMAGQPRSTSLSRKVFEFHAEPVRAAAAMLDAPLAPNGLDARSRLLEKLVAQVVSVAVPAVDA